MLLSSYKLGQLIIFSINIAVVVLCYLLQINYTVVCPDIDPLTSAAADFFQQLGTGESTSLSVVKRLHSNMIGDGFYSKTFIEEHKF